MNAVFELEVNSLRNLVKDFACLTSVGKLFHRISPALYVAEVISQGRSQVFCGEVRCNEETDQMRLEG